jgi:hypothetical protein
MAVDAHLKNEVGGNANTAAGADVTILRCHAKAKSKLRASIIDSSPREKR